MLAAELKKTLEGYNKAELVQLTTELYRKIPKKERDAQDIDGMLQNLSAYLEGKKSGKASAPLTPIEKLEEEVTLFLSYAYNQYYMAPNRYVHKKDRPKWRFMASTYIKELRRHTVEGESGDMATALLSKIYGMLSYACHYHLFITMTTFRAVGFPQAEFFDLLVARLLEKSKTPEQILACIKLLIRPYHDEETGLMDLMSPFLGRLKTADMKEIAIVQGLLHLKTLTEARNNAAKKSNASSFSFEIYEGNHTIHYLLILLFDLYEFMGDIERGIRLFKQYMLRKYDLESPAELLNLLERHNLPQLWLREYDVFSNKKATFSHWLPTQKKYVEQKGEFPPTRYQIILTED